jgi:flagellar biosynthesis protein FlhF
MEVRTFRATSLQEALEQVRVSLGPDAAILNTRSIKRGRLGLFGPREVEVDASLIEDSKQVAVIESSIGPGETSVGPINANIAPAGPSVDDSTTSAVELAIEKLLDFGVESKLADRILEQAIVKLNPQDLSDTGTLATSVQACVASQLKIVDPISIVKEKQRVIAVIGATGAGKSTVVAKMANDFLAASECRVGLVALDMVEVGKVDHLLQHAEALDLPLEIISSSSQLAPALRRLRDCNVVLIDTAGRPLDDQQQTFDLQQSFQSIGPTSKLLCVSASNSVWHTRACWQRFEVLGPHGLVITRMDEAVGLGAWLSLLVDAKVPVAYCAEGQAIRHGLRTADAIYLAEKLLPFSANRIQKR